MRAKVILTGWVVAGLLCVPGCGPASGQMSGMGADPAVGEVLFPSDVPGEAYGVGCDSAVVAKAGRTGPCTALARQVAAMIAEPAVSRAHWGVVVEGMDGTPILSLNGGQFFQPASNTKLFTTAAAMALLGPARTFETRVTGAGVWEGSTGLTGDVTIVGGGDANLNGRELPYVSPEERAARKAVNGGVAPAKADPLRYLEAMADQVAATGLKEVRGDVVGDDRLFPWEPYGPDWSIEDATWYYGAPVSALMVNDNQLDVVVTAGATAGAVPTVTMSPAVPVYYELDVKGLTTGAKGSGTHVAFDLPMGSRVLRIYGSIGVDAAPEAEGIAVYDPALYAAMAFKGMLEARGIAVSGVARAKHREVGPGAKGAAASFMATVKATSDGVSADWRAGLTGRVHGGIGDGPGPGTTKVLATRTSATVGEDVVITNKVSQNQHAEMLLHNLGLAEGLDGGGAAGAGVVRAFLTAKVGLDPGDFVFYDGSGLSGHDLVTPRATARLLEYASGQPWFAAWKASLPVGGVDGGLAGRFTAPGVKGRVWAKTGTLGEARALSGYLQGASGRTVVFSVMVTDHAPGGTADREVMDRIVAAVAAAE